MFILNSKGFLIVENDAISLEQRTASAALHGEYILEMDHEFPHQRPNSKDRTTKSGRSRQPGGQPSKTGEIPQRPDQHAEGPGESVLEFFPQAQYGGSYDERPGSPNASGRVRRRADVWSDVRSTFPAVEVATNVWGSQELHDNRNAMRADDVVLLNNMESAFFSGDLEKLMQLLKKPDLSQPAQQMRQLHALKNFKVEMEELGFRVQISNSGEVTIGNFHDLLKSANRILSSVNLDPKNGKISAVIYDEDEGSPAKRETHLSYSEKGDPLEFFGFDVTDRSNVKSVPPAVTSLHDFVEFIRGDIESRQHSIEEKREEERQQLRLQERVDNEQSRRDQEHEQAIREMERLLREQARKSEEDKRKKPQ